MKSYEQILVLKYTGTNFKKRDPFLTLDRKKIPCREVCMVRENPHHRIWRYILDRYQYWATTGPHACFPQSEETYSVTATRKKEQVKLMSIFCALLSQTNIWSPLRISFFKDKKFIFGNHCLVLSNTVAFITSILKHKLEGTLLDGLVVEDSTF